MTYDIRWRRGNETIQRSLTRYALRANDPCPETLKHMCGAMGNTLDLLQVTDVMRNLFIRTATLQFDEEGGALLVFYACICDDVTTDDVTLLRY